MSLDLHEIRERALPTRDGFYHVVGAHRVMREEDFDALVAEVERLRAEVKQERAAVVAYLAKRGLIGAAEGVREGDHRIERGEHRRDPTETEKP